MKRMLAWFLCLVMVFTMAPTEFSSIARAGEVPQEETQTDTEETGEAEETEDISAEEEIKAEEDPEPAEKEEPAVESESRPEPKQEENVRPAAEEERPEPAREDGQEELTEEPPAPEETPADGTSDAAQTEGELPAQNPDDGTDTEEKKSGTPQTPAAEPEDGKTDPPETEKKEEKSPVTEKPADQPQEEAGFQAGYVKIRAGEKLYKDPICSRLLGTLQEEAVAYAAEQDEQTGHVSVVLAVEGNAVFAWLSGEKAEALSEAETERQENAAEDLLWADQVKLINVQLALTEEAPAQTAQQEEGDPETEGSPEEASAEPEPTEAPGGAGEQAVAEAAEETSEDGEAEEEEEFSEPADEKEDIGAGAVYGEGGYLVPQSRPIPDWGEDAPIAKDSVRPPEAFDFYQSGEEIYPFWKAAANSYYELQRRENEGPWIFYTIEGEKKLYCPEDGYYSISDTKVRGRAYQYRIRAFDSYGISHSDWVYISVFYTGKISASAKANSKTAVPTVKWSKAKGATGYYIYRKTTNRYTGAATNWKLVKKISGNKTFAYADKSIAINRHYDYEIVPVRQVGKKTIGAYSSYTGKVGVNVRPLSGAPENVKVRQVSSGVKLTWDKVRGAKGYIIYYTNNPYAAKPIWKKLVATKKTAYTHKDKIKPGTSGIYRRYRIYPTAVIMGKTKKGPVASTDIIRRLAAPTVRLTKGSEEDTVIVSWDRVKGANLYQIYFKLDGEESYRCGKVEGNYTSVLLTGAQNISGTKKNLFYVVPVSTSNKTGKSQAGGRSATKAITPYWYRVLISYNDYYPDMSYASNLANKGKEKDMKGLKKVFSGQSVKLAAVRNASRSELISAISSTFGGATKNTVCIFCFTGHGVSEYGYYTGALGYPDFLLSPSELKSLLDRNVPSDHVVLLISACGSGGLIKGGSAAEEEIATAYTNAWIRTFQADEGKHGELASGNRYSVMTSADLYHNSYSVYNSYTGYGAYSYFMRGICRGGGYDFFTGNRTGKLADKNRNGKVTFNELFSYVRSYAKKSTLDNNEGAQVAQKYTMEPNLIIFP